MALQVINIDNYSWKIKDADSDTAPLSFYLMKGMNYFPEKKKRRCHAQSERLLPVESHGIWNLQNDNFPVRFSCAETYRLAETILHQGQKATV